MSEKNTDEAVKATIFYYTGTGNSLWAARYIARSLGDARVVSMTGGSLTDNVLSSPVMILVFPVHIWGVPGRVLQFLDALKGRQYSAVFAVATNGGQVSNTLVQLQQEMDNRGLALSAGWSIHLPSNYIPWGGPGPQEKQKQLFRKAEEKLGNVITGIEKHTIQSPEKGPLWQRLIFSFFYKKATPMIPKMDDKFWADSKCNLCQVCIRVCPANNIVLEGEALRWKHQCEQCLACIQWCPQEALQYGKRSSRNPRYHHPEIQLRDMFGE